MQHIDSTRAESVRCTSLFYTLPGDAITHGNNSAAKAMYVIALCSPDAENCNKKILVLHPGAALKRISAIESSHNTWHVVWNCESWHITCTDLQGVTTTGALSALSCKQSLIQHLLSMSQIQAQSLLFLRGLFRFQDRQTSITQGHVYRDNSPVASGSLI